MLAKEQDLDKQQLSTEGFENKHKVKIYETDVIVNATEIDFAERLSDPGTKIPEPILKRMVYIEARIPQARSGYNGPLTDKHKENFPKMWEAFLKRQSRLEEHGTALTQMPEISTGVVERLKSLGIVSIEALSDIDDITAGRIPNGVKMREKAKKVLEAIRGNITSQSSQKLVALEERLAATEAKLEESTQQAQALAEIIKDYQKNQKKAS